MNHQIKKYVSKNVVDYYVTVGANNEIQLSNDQLPKDCDNISIYEAPLKPVLLDRYPLKDRLNNPLPDGIVLFCFPNKMTIYNEMRIPYFHPFVHTSADGQRMLGCCLTFYEPLTLLQLESLQKYDIISFDGDKDNKDKYFLPKCICVISHWSYATSFKKFLCRLYQRTLTPNPVPIERFVCNFVDDVPAPLVGKVDVTYYIGEDTITFRCPPANQPNAWCGLPLFPLFECLSPETVLLLFALILTERQILFISSQYNLLTTSAEAIINLMYPLTWTHAYIPILPLKLLGVLSAPFPFILGIHTDFLTSKECVINDETARVYLDDNEIDVGSLGPPPALPNRKYRKLLAEIITAGPIFSNRGKDWKEERLIHFDDAYTSVCDLPSCTFYDEILVDENVIKSSFLKFFVAILKNYRRHLIYGNADEPDPLVKFNFEDFISGSVTEVMFVSIDDMYPLILYLDDLSYHLKCYELIHAWNVEQPSDWHPFLRELVATQSFAHFVDSRILEISNNADVIFFDESIDAKENRYTFRLRKIDTPFLNDENDNHVKTYVSPTPNLIDIPEFPTQRCYARFPLFDPSLFSPSRPLPASLDLGVSETSIHLARLKRLNPQSSAAGTKTSLSSAACVYSVYITVLCNVVCLAQMKSVKSRQIAMSRHKASTLVDIIDEFAPDARGSRRLKNIQPAILKRQSSLESPTVQDPTSIPENSLSETSAEVNGDGSLPLTNNETAATVSRSRSNTTAVNITSYNQNTVAPLNFDDFDSERSKNQKSSSITSNKALAHAAMNEMANMDSAKLALKIALEALDCVSRLDEGVEDVAYRSLANACGACGFAQQVFEIIVHMQDEGMLPDTQMLTSVARAIANDAKMKAYDDSSHSFKQKRSALDDGDRRPLLIQSEVDTSVNNKYKQIKYGEKNICSADVWTLQDWQWKFLVPEHGSIYRRKVLDKKQANTRAAPPADKNGSIYSWIFKTSNNTTMTTILPTSPSVLNSKKTVPPTSLPSGNSNRVSSPTQSSFEAFKTSSNSTITSFGDTLEEKTRSSDDASISSSSSSRDREVSTTSSQHLSNDRRDSAFSCMNAEGVEEIQKGKKKTTSYNFPELQWKELMSPDRHPIYNASERVSRQMIYSENLLQGLYPGLNIDLEHPLGMACPGQFRKPCPSGQPLTLNEIYSGWKQGQANNYTTKCVYCGTKFVPRFTVQCSSEDWIGTDGEGTPLWCELLSPWTLRKELFNILFTHGIDYIMSERFRSFQPSATDHESSCSHSVLFWNIIIILRLYGLPYSFFLCDEDEITRAFPTNFVEE